MEKTTFTTIKDVFNYIHTNCIQNIEVRFLDNKGKIRSFCINATLLTPQIFTSNSFKFCSYTLLPLDLNRVFKDPFLPNPTLIFFTNLLEHSNKILELKHQLGITSLIVSYFFDNSSNSNHNYNLAFPPLDNTRTIRDEIVLAASKTNITIKTHFCKNKGGNILIIENKNKLVQLDNTEKIKYIILMVSKIFNKEIDTTKGIFNTKPILY